MRLNTAALLAGAAIALVGGAPAASSAPPRGADVSVTIADSPDPTKARSTIVYDVTVSNAGPESADGVAFVLSLPAEVLYQSVTTSQGTCTGTEARLECRLGVLGKRSKATLQIRGYAAKPGTATAAGSVTAITADPKTENNSASATTTINPSGISGTMTAPAQVAVGEPAHLGVSLVNHDFPDEVSIVLLLSHPSEKAAFVYEPAVTSKGTCTHSTVIEPEVATPYSGRYVHVRCLLGRLQPGERVTMSFAPRVSEAACDQPMIADLYHEALPMGSGSHGDLDRKSIYVSTLSGQPCPPQVLRGAGRSTT